MASKFGPMVVWPSIQAVDEVCDNIIIPMDPPKTELTFEQRIWLGVVVQAFTDLKSSRHRRRAETWILSASNKPQSFRWAIDVVGLDADACQDKVRKRLGSGESLGVICLHR